MKKIVISALSAAALLVPASAFACMMDMTEDAWSMNPGMTNVSAKAKMDMRVDTMMDARKRMNENSGEVHPMYHMGRPGRRSVQSNYRAKLKLRLGHFKSIQGYNAKVESDAEAR